MTSRRYEFKYSNRWTKHAVLATLGWAVCGCGDTPLSLVHVCDDYCAQVEQASCPNSTSRADCITSCVDNGASLDRCRSAWRSYVACMSEHVPTCDENGVDVPPLAACEEPQRALDACVAKAGR